MCNGPRAGTAFALSTVVASELVWMPPAGTALGCALFHRANRTPEQNATEERHANVYLGVGKEDLPISIHPFSGCQKADTRSIGDGLPLLPW